MAATLSTREEALAGSWPLPPAIHHPLSLRMTAQVFGAAVDTLLVAAERLIEATYHSEENPVILGWQVHASDASLPVDPRRTAAFIGGLARITEPNRPFTRRSFTPLFLERRAVIADGTEATDGRLAHALTNDTALGVIRYAHAGYAEAHEEIAEKGIG